MVPVIAMVHRHGWLRDLRYDEQDVAETLEALERVLPC
jgi:hypothetical protein